MFHWSDKMNSRSGVVLEIFPSLSEFCFTSTSMQQNSFFFSSLHKRDQLDNRQCTGQRGAIQKLLLSAEDILSPIQVASFEYSWSTLREHHTFCLEQKKVPLVLVKKRKKFHLLKRSSILFFPNWQNHHLRNFCPSIVFIPSFIYFPVSQKFFRHYPTTSLNFYGSYSTDIIQVSTAIVDESHLH